jgi:hypothetical protein
VLYESAALLGSDLKPPRPTMSFLRGVLVALRDITDALIIGACRDAPSANQEAANRLG